MIAGLMMFAVQAATAPKPSLPPLTAGAAYGRYMSCRNVETAVAARSVMLARRATDTDTVSQADYEKARELGRTACGAIERLAAEDYLAKAVAAGLNKGVAPTGPERAAILAAIINGMDQRARFSLGAMIDNAKLDTLQKAILTSEARCRQPVDDRTYCKVK